MSENENIGQSENPKKPLPLWRRILVALVLLAMLLLAGSMLASFWMGRQLGRQIAAISQAGEPLTFPDPKTDQPALTDPNDAARLYREALMSISSAHLQQLTNFNLAYRSQIISLPPDQIAQPVREQAAKFEEILQPVLEKIDQAASMDLGHFDLEITKGLKIFMDRLTRANICSLMMSLRTLDHIAHNQADAAADSAVGMLKLVRILDDQPLVNTLPTRIQGAGLASEDIRLLLERTEPSPAALIKLQQALEKVHPENLLVKMEEMNLEKAQRSGAVGVFESKYGDKVKVYSIGDSSTSSEPPFSREICGGPHVAKTSELGIFKIVKEESVARGIRRIRAILVNS